MIIRAQLVIGGPVSATQLDPVLGNHGRRPAGTIDVSPDPACIADMIASTLSDVVDDGGIKRRVPEATGWQGSRRAGTHDTLRFVADGLADLTRSCDPGQRWD